MSGVTHMDSVGFPRAHRRDRRDDRHCKGDRPDRERDVRRAGRRHGCEQCCEVDPIRWTGIGVS